MEHLIQNWEWHLVDSHGCKCRESQDGLCGFVKYTNRWSWIRRVNYLLFSLQYLITKSLTSKPTDYLLLTCTHGRVFWPNWGLLAFPYFPFLMDNSESQFQILHFKWNMNYTVGTFNHRSIFCSINSVDMLYFCKAPL